MLKLDGIPGASTMQLIRSRDYLASQDQLNHAANHVRIIANQTKKPSRVGGYQDEV